MHGGASTASGHASPAPMRSTPGSSSPNGPSATPRRLFTHSSPNWSASTGVQVLQKPAVWLHHGQPPLSPRPPTVSISHRPAPRLSPHGHRPTQTQMQTQTQATQATQTTEFLRFFESLEADHRLAMRGERAQLDADLQTRLLADRQLLHELMRGVHWSPRRPQASLYASKPPPQQRSSIGRERHASDALSSGYSSVDKYTFESHEMLLALTHAYEEQMHGMRLLVERMGERNDHVEDFESA